MKGAILACLLAAAAGCGGGGDVDAAGNYTVALTNGANGCNLGNFNPGDSASGVNIVITQDKANLSVEVMGLGPVLFLDALLGNAGNKFTGDVDGDEISVDSLGTRSNTSGNCTYTYNAHISGTLDGDVLVGRIEYRAADNGNSDCTQVHGCLTYQDYNGTRPPQ